MNEEGLRRGSSTFVKEYFMCYRLDVLYCNRAQCAISWTWGLQWRIRWRWRWRILMSVEKQDEGIRNENTKLEMESRWCFGHQLVRRPRAPCATARRRRRRRVWGIRWVRRRRWRWRWRC